MIFALPRSRTAWLSRFLSYGGWHCGHDEVRHFRSLDDAKAWLSQPLTGTVETAAAPFWRTLRDLRPDAKVVVVRRPVEDVVTSLLRLGLGFERAALLPVIQKLDRKLEQITRRVPNALVVQYSDLEREDVCATVFEHCTGFPHDTRWWSYVAPQNTQVNMAATLRYFVAHREPLVRTAAMAKHATLRQMARRPAGDLEGVNVQVEDFDSFYRDSERMFEDHCASVGESPDAHMDRNFPLMRALHAAGGLQVVTARSNGRLFGYLLTIISPSLNSPDDLTAEHRAFYADPSFRGLGMRIQRVSRADLRQRGVDDLLLRSGVRGDGPRLGPIYERMGAEDQGRLFRLKLKD